MIAPTREDGPMIWAHAATPAALDAMIEVLMRAQMIEPSLSYVLSAPTSEYVFDSAVVRLQEADLQLGQDFLKKMSPDLCLWADDSISKPLFGLIQRFPIQIILINAKTQKLRGRTWLLRKTVARQALRPVAYAFVETVEASGHLRNLGLAARNIEVLGQFLGGVVAPGCDEAERDRLGEILTGRPVWFAHQVPSPEIKIVLQAFLQAQRRAHQMLLIFDLADPSNEAELLEICKELDLITHARAVEGEPNSRTQIFLTEDCSDTGLWYRLASVSYMGGSFSGSNLPNPMIAAALGSAVVHGPDVIYFQYAYARLCEAGATRPLQQVDDLSQRVAELMEPDQCAVMAEKGWRVVSEGAVITDRLVELALQKIGFGDSKK
tara:strand:- start:130 stop:1266 length:1137 start_codon:yes stop_codon:yes gene_type:complete